MNTGVILVPVGCRKNVVINSLFTDYTYTKPETINEANKRDIKDGYPWGIPQHSTDKLKRSDWIRRK